MSLRGVQHLLQLCEQASTRAGVIMILTSVELRDALIQRICAHFRAHQGVRGTYVEIAKDCFVMVRTHAISTRGFGSGMLVLFHPAERFDDVVPRLLALDGVVAHMLVGETWTSDKGEIRDAMARLPVNANL